MSAYTASHLPQHRGPALWNALLKPPPPPCVLETKSTADFVIIGAGFAGLSAARRLSQLHPKARIVVLEAGRLAEGAAGRNSGFMIDLPHDLSSSDYANDSPSNYSSNYSGSTASHKGQIQSPDQQIITLNRQAIGFAEQAVTDYDINPVYFAKDGKINGAASPTAHRHNLSYSQHLNQLHEANTLLDAQDMRSLTGSRHYISGLYTPGTVMLQPAGYIRGLAKGLKAQNPALSIYENSAVIRFTPQGGDWCVETPKGALTTPCIILANNGHLESFGFKKGRLLQLFLFASISPQLDDEMSQKLGGAPRWGITPSDPMGTTLRRIDTPLGGSRIITRTLARLRFNMVPKADDMKRASRIHQKKFDQRFPQLAGLKMQYGWAGHLCLSLNGVSVTQQLAPNVFSACVQNGLGTARGTLTGIAAAEMASNHTSAITAFFQKEVEPKPLLPKPLAQTGANLYFKWKEWRAAQD